MLIFFGRSPTLKNVSDKPARSLPRPVFSSISVDREIHLNMDDSLHTEASQATPDVSLCRESRAITPRRNITLAVAA
jgi:hypothetical protein